MLINTLQYPCSCASISLQSPKQFYTYPNTNQDMASQSHRSSYLELRCRHCGNPGHKVSKCPSVTCFKCQRKGHIARGCPDKDPCERCFKTSHVTDRCPYNTPQYSGVTFIPVPSNARKRAAEDSSSGNQLLTTREQVSPYTNHDGEISLLKMMQESPPRKRQLNPPTFRQNPASAIEVQPLDRAMFVPNFGPSYHQGEVSRVDNDGSATLL